MRTAQKPDYLPETPILTDADIYSVYDPAKDIHGANIDLYIERARFDFRREWWNFIENFYS